MTKPRTKKEISFPFEFEKNGRTGKIYKLGNGTFKTYFVFASKPRANTFGKFETAFDYLDKEFTRLDEDRANALSLNPLDGDVRNYSELEQLLRNEGGGATLREAVAFFLANHKHKHFTPQTVNKCIERFLDAKERDNVSPIQIKTLAMHARRFARTFGERLIHEIPVIEIEEWLGSQRDEKTLAAWSTKTRTGVRGSLVSLSLFAQKTLKAIPDIGDTEFQKVRIPKPDKRAEVEIYAPREIRALLVTAIENDISLIPSIALGCFAGLRPAEFHAEGLERSPLDWKAFNWNDSTLHVDGQKIRSKATRDIPMNAVLKAWLKPFVEKSGPIWKFKQAHTKKLLALREKAEVQSIYDGFRHSYASYRIRQLKQDLKLLAAEMGNSPEEILNSYKRNVTDAEAEVWFSLMPPKGYEALIAAALAEEKAKEEKPPLPIA